MKIRGYKLDVDVLEEIESFQWEKKKIQGNEFQACSPFREERRPSFYVNLEKGTFIDHGADDDTWKKGSLVKLLSFLYNWTTEEVEDYLIERYAVETFEVAEGKELNINLQWGDEKPKVFTKDDLKPYLFRKKSYLEGRGIGEEIQKKFVVGFDKSSNAVAFFWRDAFTGKVVNIKFRSIKSKQFFYVRGGQKVSNHVFALYNVIQEKYSKVYVVESETDALYLWQHNIPAIALGGSYLSPEQKRKILRSGIETLVLATDDDKAGKRIKSSIIAELGGYVELLEVDLPEYAGDINDVKKEDIKNVTESERPVTPTFTLLT
ncbi:toprim domain-containing protein [Halobacillus karajensis]|uniref:toprim domain-containing protein n=1 Tax=Halobacillus karajensis TaxID=195088 RepID=UPI00045C68C9|nr:toprim domain-containing protein [Halobacillus karajensis]CDQ21721.1 DNA primase [Halobacillus karajensis]